MSYPKPLSEKTISRFYAEAALSERQVAFIHSFAAACASLYGVISAQEAWDVYRELSEKTQTIRLRRKDLYTALGILRREQLPYYVFEVDEVYGAEKRMDKMRLIVTRQLVLPGYGKFCDLYRVEKVAGDKPFFVPADLLDYPDRPEGPYERRLLKFFDGLKSTLTEYETPWGDVRPCKYTGKYLNEFSYISDYEEFDLSWLRGEIEGHKGNMKMAEELEARLSVQTASRYLVEKLKRHNTVADMEPGESLKYVLEDLTAMGVDLTDDELSELVGAASDMNNHQNLWCNRGWTPADLMEVY